jgi:hypothetical protein
MPNLPYSSTKRDKDGNRKWKIRHLVCDCGTKFTTHNPAHKYCTQKCKHNATMRRIRDGKKKRDKGSNK